MQWWDTSAPDWADVWAGGMPDNRLSDLQQGNFNSSVGPDGYMLSAVTCGMSPVTSITEGLQQVPVSERVWPNDFNFTIHRFCLFHTDRHHGIISHHCAVLPGEFWQHRAPLHDSEGAVESSRQTGIAAAAMPLQAGTPPLPHYPRPALQLVRGKEASLWTHFWCHLNCGRCLLYACLLM